MATETQQLTLIGAWNETLSKMGGDAKLLGGQLAAAGKEYPELVASLKLLLAYQGHLAKQHELVTANAQLRGGIPTNDIWPPFPWPPGPPLPWPSDPWEEICRTLPTLCKCLEGDPDACPDLEVDRPEATWTKPFGQVPRCKQIRAAYKAALECALKYCGQRSLTYSDHKEWARCQRNINHYWNQLHETGCLNLRDYCAIAEELGTGN